MEVARKAAADWNCDRDSEGAPDRDRRAGWLRLDEFHRESRHGTGGTGDVLTGMLAGLTAQYFRTLPSWEKCWLRRVSARARGRHRVRGIPAKRR